MIELAPLLFRKRIIPEETVLLNSDEITIQTENVIVTKWKPIKPRADIGSGESVTFINKGYKISKFYNNAGAFIYWYCDIIDTEYNEIENSYTFTDLIADVLITPDGFVKVLDIADLSSAFENNLITDVQLKKTLNRLAELLDIIYENKLESIVDGYFTNREDCFV